MADQLTVLKLEKMEQDVDRLIPIVQQTHDAVIELGTRFDGGPGNWPSCQQHSETLANLMTRMDKVEKRMFMALGAVVLLAPVATGIGEHFVKVLFKP